MNKTYTIPKKKKKQTLNYTKFEHLVRFTFILNFLHHGFFFLHSFFTFIKGSKHIYIDTYTYYIFVSNVI